MSTMELQKWKIFQNLDPIFAGDIKRAYLVGISSFEEDENKEDSDEEGKNSYLLTYLL